MAHNHICGFYYSTCHPERPRWNQWQRHYLPQVSLKSHTTILSRTSRTVLTQTFTNPNQSKAIKNFRYTFPLYDGVSVVGFTCRVGHRIIKGRVKEKEQAKAEFDRAVERGQTAGLLEQLPDASDVFTTTVGNIPPGATIVSEITYLGELKHDAEVDGIRFTIPTAIAPRYGEYPGELLNNPDSSAAHANSGMEIVVDAVLDDGSYIKQLRSPTHPIAVSMGTTSASPDAEPTMSKASATLSLGSAELEKDFVVQVIAKDTGKPTAILEVHPRIPNQRALMTTLVPKFSLPSTKPEIVFICDRSGSMDDGYKIPTAISALKVFLKSLPVGVKFNICSFGSRYSFLWPKSKAYTQDSLNEAIRHVEGFSADYGGTEIFNPLKATIDNRYKDMELEIMLLTDGDVWQHQRIFAYLNEQIQEKKEQIRVFTIGIGLDASSALIEGVARAGNGFSQAVGNNEKLDSKVVRMLKGALTPHITDYSLEVKYAGQNEKSDAGDDFEIVERVADSLRVDLTLQDEEAEDDQKQPISLFDESVDLDATEVREGSADGRDRYAHLPPLDAPSILQTPTRIPALFPFNRTTIYLLLSPNSPAAGRRPTSVILRGTSAHGPLELGIPVKLATENDGKGETIHQLAAHKAVLELEEGRGWLSEAVDATGAKLKERMQGRWDEIVQREAARLGVEFQVGGKWCSFVALEEEEHASEGGEKDRMDQDWEYLDLEPQSPPSSPSSSSGSEEDSERTDSNHRRPPGHHQNGPRSRGGRGGYGGRGGGRGGLALPAMVTRDRALDTNLLFQGKGMQMQQLQPQLQLQQAASMAAPWSSSSSPCKKRKKRMMVMSARRSFVDAESVIDYSDDDDGDEPSTGAGRFLRDVSDSDDADMSAPPPAARDLTDAEREKWEAQTPLEQLIALQRFEGCWEWDERLLRAVGVSEKEAVAKGLSPGKVAATVLAISYLRKVLGHEESSWELLVEKAEEWVRENGGSSWELKKVGELAEGLVAGK